MGHKIATAVIENGQIKYVDKKLPAGRIKVHLIYDTTESPLPGNEVARIVRETSGLYTDIDVEAESGKLRDGWKGVIVKTANPKSSQKSSRLKPRKKRIVQGKHAMKKKHSLAQDPFFSSSPVDLGRTNNKIIDQILYGKNGA